MHEPKAVQSDEAGNGIVDQRIKLESIHFNKKEKGEEEL